MFRDRPWNDENWNDENWKRTCEGVLSDVTGFSWQYPVSGSVMYLSGRLAWMWKHSASLRFTHLVFQSVTAFCQ